jgi:hypothetical protein
VVLDLVGCVETSAAVGLVHRRGWVKNDGMPSRLAVIAIDAVRHN